VTIAAFLEEAKPRLVQRVMELLEVAKCDSLPASLGELVDDLTQSARQGRVDVSVERHYIKLGTDPEILLAKLRALREGLFAELAERAPTCVNGLADRWIGDSSQASSVMETA